MKIIVEEISRSKKVLHRHVFDNKSSITIGRAFDNDIIINEAHVCPNHLKLERRENDVWIVHDLNSVNGVKSDKRKMLPNDYEIGSGETIMVGRSYIRVWDEHHPVEPAWPLHSIEEIFHTISRYSFVSILLVLYFLSQWLMYSLFNYQAFPLNRILNESLYVLMFMFGWSSLWGLSGRVIRHESRFLSHLSVTIVITLIFQWLPSLFEIFAYNNLWGSGLTVVRYFSNGILLSLLVWCNFYLALPQKPLDRVIWSNVIAWGVVSIYLLPWVFETKQFNPYPIYDRLLLSPTLHYKKGITVSDFVEKVDELYSNADQNKRNNEEKNN